MDFKAQINTYFICATQYYNLGDLVINKLLIDELSNYGCVFVDLAGVPEDFKRPLLEKSNVFEVSSYGFSVKRLSIKNIIKFILFLRRHDVKLITRSPGPLCDPSRMIRFGFRVVNILSRIIGAKVVYFGNCCSQALLEQQTIKSTYMNAVYLRSYASVEYASKHVNSKVAYIPDMAFLLKTKNSYIKQKKVIVDYRPVQNNSDSSNSDLYSLVQQFMASGYSVELYCQVKNDEQELQVLYKLLKPLGVTIRHQMLWYDDIESYYSDKAFVISNRLHSLLFGMAYGVIPIARITRDSKVIKIQHVFNSSLPEQFYHEIGVENVVDIANYIAHEEDYRTLISECVQTNARTCADVIQDVMLRIENI